MPQFSGKWVPFPNLAPQSAENTGQLGPKTPPFLGPKICQIQAKKPQNTSKSSESAKNPHFYPPIGRKHRSTQSKNPRFEPPFEWFNRPKTQVNSIEKQAKNRLLGPHFEGPIPKKRRSTQLKTPQKGPIWHHFG